MYFLVYDAGGRLRFESGSWPMARAALDYLVAQSADKDCPKLVVLPDSAHNERAADINGPLPDARPVSDAEVSR